MRILLCHRVDGAFGYITDGWLNALNNSEHSVRRWDGLESSWREYSPDLYIGCSGHKQPIPPTHNTKIAIHVNPYGPIAITGINESQEAIRWTLNQNPDVVFGYGREEDRLAWSYWTTKHNIPWVPQPTAGDREFFKQVTALDQRTVDLVYLGGRWSYKGQTIDQYLLPALQRSKAFKVHGWGDWPPGLSSGILPQDQVVQFLNSGKVAPCVSEAHTQRYGIDIPERAFKAALCGTLVVHDPVSALKRMLPSAVVSQNPENFVNLCMHYAEHDNERIELVQQQQIEVLENHTYHHRLRDLFRAIGWDDEADKIVS